MAWYDAERITVVRYNPKPYSSSISSGRMATSVYIPVPPELKEEGSRFNKEKRILGALTPALETNEVHGDIDQRGAIVFQILCRVHPYIEQLYFSPDTAKLSDTLISHVRDLFATILLPLGWTYEAYPSSSSSSSTLSSISSPSMATPALPWPAHHLLHMISTSLPSLRCIYTLINTLLLSCELHEKWGPSFLSALVLGREPREFQETRIFWDEWRDWRSANSYEGGKGMEKKEDFSVRMLVVKCWGLGNGD